MPLVLLEIAEYSWSIDAISRAYVDMSTLEDSDIHLVINLTYLFDDDATQTVANEDQRTIQLLVSHCES